MLDLEPAIADGPDAVPLGEVRGALAFKSVSFAHGSGTEVLHDLDLDIAPGQSVAFVGPSGSGKSTLAALVEGSTTRRQARLPLIVSTSGEFS